MKKTFSLICFMLFLLITLTGCTEFETESKDAQTGESKKVFQISDTAVVNNTEVKINSVKKVLKECSWEWEGKCSSYNKPENDYFLVIDMTITNNSDKEMSVSSLLSFDIKDSNGEKGSLKIMLNAVKSSLDGSIMPNDKLKGQIAFDVKDSEEYSFYYQDSLLDDNIKFIIKQSDIQS